jgi:hypothetical protein
VGRRGRESAEGGKAVGGELVPRPGAARAQLKLRVPSPVGPAGTPFADTWSPVQSSCPVGRPGRGEDGDSTQGGASAKTPSVDFTV